MVCPHGNGNTDARLAGWRLRFVRCATIATAHMAPFSNMAPHRTKKIEFV
jgi:hypothetical protein